MVWLVVASELVGEAVEQVCAFLYGRGCRAFHFVGYASGCFLGLVEGAVRVCLLLVERLLGSLRGLTYALAGVCGGSGGFFLDARCHLGCFFANAFGFFLSLLLHGFGLFVLLMAAGVFRLCQRLGRDGVPEPVLYLSRASFCVYLIHPYFQWLTRQAFFETLSPVWAVPAQALLLLGLSAAAYEVLRRVPVVSRWII